MLYKYSTNVSTQTKLSSTEHLAAEFEVLVVSLQMLQKAELIQKDNSFEKHETMFIYFYNYLFLMESPQTKDCGGKYDLFRDVFCFRGESLFKFLTESFATRLESINTDELRRGDFCALGGA